MVLERVRRLDPRRGEENSEDVPCNEGDTGDFGRGGEDVQGSGGEESLGGGEDVREVGVRRLWERG